MTEPYVYTDSDGVHMSIGSMPDPAVSGAWLTLSRADLHIAPDAAPAVCAQILAAAGRSDVRVAPAGGPAGDRPDLAAIAARRHRWEATFRKFDAFAYPELAAIGMGIADEEVRRLTTRIATLESDRERIARALQFPAPERHVDASQMVERITEMRAERDQARAARDDSRRRAEKTEALRSELEGEVRRLTAELATARHQERERSLDAAMRTFTTPGPDDASHRAAIVDAIRALPDEDTPATAPLSVLIEPRDLYIATADTRQCPRCQAGVGIHVEIREGAITWSPVRIHTMPCADAPTRTTTEESQ